MGAELESGRLGGLLHRVKGGEEGRGVDAVAHCVAGLGGHLGGGHRGTSPYCGLMVGGCARGQAVASRRSPGIGREASTAASASMAALSCFWSAMNAGTAG